MMNIALLAHIASTLYMTGLIWFVQVVHYPLHGHVGEENFQTYQTLHVNWTGYVVGPPMLIEMATTVYFLMNPMNGIPYRTFVVGAVVLALIWASTALFQVPFHNALVKAFQSDAHSKLVSSNWIRTIGWTVRGGLALYMIHCLIAK